MVDYTEPAGSPESLAELGYADHTWDRPWHLPRGQLTTVERMPSAVLSVGAGPVQQWPRGEQLDLTAIEVVDPLTSRPSTLSDLLRDRLRADAFLIVHDGRILAESYFGGMREDDLHLVHSCSKTLTTMMVGIAIAEGVIDPAAEVTDLLEELAGIAAWHGVTVQHVLDMASGHATEEDYERPESMYWRYADAVGYYGPTDATTAAGALGFVQANLIERAAEPGSVFNYASYLTNLLPEIVSRAYGVPAVELYERRLYQRLGCESPCVVNLDRFGRPVVEGHLNLTLRDFARWSWLLADEGRNLAGEQVLPPEWVGEAFRPDPQRRAAFERSDAAESMPGAEYHNQAWLVDPGAGVLALLGIHGQFAFVQPSRRLMMVGVSSYPDQWNSLLDSLLDVVWAATSAAIRS